jgi:hypothetical protein
MCAARRGPRTVGDNEVSDTSIFQHRNIATSQHRNIATSQHRNIATSQHRNINIKIATSTLEK